MAVKDGEYTETDHYLAALVSNAGAIRAVTEAVQGTLGPKGLDCMLVDQFGGIVVTNDGVTILKTMDVTHPAARILISAAEHQEEQVGDGTTTATIIAGTLINEGVNQIIKGVPVMKVTAGIRIGIEQALRFLAEDIIPIDDLYSPVLEGIALVSAREHRDLAKNIINAARIVGPAALLSDSYKLAEQIIAIEGSADRLLQGTIIHHEHLNQGMPCRITDGKIIILDDALEPLKIDYQALTTEIGFSHQLQQEQELIRSIHKLADLGVKAVFSDRAICDLAEDLLTDLGIIGVQGVAAHEWKRLAEMAGARPIKKNSLLKSADEILKLTGDVAEILVDDKFKHIEVLVNPNRNFVTIIIGANTKEVVGERERIAKDAASAVQAAWRGGVVPGGGSVELSIARKMSQSPIRDMNYYGYLCVIEALKQPFIQICSNAGFHSLEKLEEVLVQQELTGLNSIGLDCNTGKITDLSQFGIWDPYLVKYHAIKTAGEVGEAILRIQMMIKMKEEIQHS